MTPRRPGWGRLGLVAAGVALVDQVVKAVVVSELHVGEAKELTGWLEIAHSRNEGVAFGLFDGGGAGIVALGLLALVLMLAYFATQPRRSLLWLTGGAVAGGALGNLADRLFRGSVVDYVDLSFWPAFNLADAAIVVGVAGLILVTTARDAPAEEADERSA